MNTLTSKLLSLGIMAALGGFGLTAGPAVGAHLPSIASEAIEQGAPTELVLSETSEDDVAPAATALESDGVDESGVARSARELAHQHRDAVRSRPASAHDADGESAEPGARGAERRTAARGIGAARREAVHAMNAARRAAGGAVEPRESEHEGSEAGHGRGRAARANDER